MGAKQNSRAKHSNQSHRPKAKAHWSKSKPSLYIGGLAGALVLAIFSTLGTGIGNTIWAKVKGGSGPVYSGSPARLISVDVQRNDTQGDTFIFPQRLQLTRSQLGQVNDWMTKDVLGASENFDPWARAHGGVDPNYVNIRLILEGNRAHPVRILDMRPVGACQKPLSGTAFISPPAGSDPSVVIGFNLDTPTPDAETYSQSAGFGSNYFDAKTVSLKSDEQQVFEIVARTLTRYCHFDIEATVQDGSKQINEIFSNNGHPFKVSALAVDDQRPDFQQLYVGGVISPSCNDKFVPENPRTYNVNIQTPA